MIDLFRQPYTDRLHIVERHRLVDHAEPKTPWLAATKENRRAAGPYNPNYSDKYLRVDFTIETPALSRPPGPQ